MVNVARAHGEIEDFAAAHDDALQGYLQPFGLDWLDGVDDERRGDFVKLPRTALRKEVAFKQALFFFVRNDAAAL